MKRSFVRRERVDGGWWIVDGKSRNTGCTFHGLLPRTDEAALHPKEEKFILTPNPTSSEDAGRREKSVCWREFGGCDILLPCCRFASWQSYHPGCSEAAGVIFTKISFMLTKKPQAISGVSSNYENVLEELYPSIATTGLGQLLNWLYRSIPYGFGQIWISHVLFVLPTLPLALLAYFLLKVAGSKYLITNRAVKRVTSLTSRTLEEAPLAQVDQVTVDPDSRQAFYKTGDVRLTNAAGDTLLLLRGVPHPDRFVQVILETRDARKLTEESLVTIRARK
jgi:hypothetical protein